MLESNTIYTNEKMSAICRLRKFFEQKENVNKWISKEEIYVKCYPRQNRFNKHLDMFMSRSMNVSLTQIRKDYLGVTNFALISRKIDGKPHYKLADVKNFGIANNYLIGDYVAQLTGIDNKFEIIRIPTNVDSASELTMQLRYATPGEAKEFRNK